MILKELVALVKEQNIPVTTHTKKIAAGGVFVVLPPSVPLWKRNETAGAEQYLPEIARSGAKYIVLAEEHAPLLQKLGSISPTVVLCKNARKALGELAAARFRTTQKLPKIVGITGTNGKTTESYLLEHLFTSLGQSVGILGTVEYRWPGHHEEAPLTTPGCIELHTMLASMREAGTDWAFMEVSSHALDQDRVAGISFSGALMTNLTQDHLDYHETFDEYYEAKARLFRPTKNNGVAFDNKAGAINSDDVWGQKLLKETPDAISFGLEGAPIGHSCHLHGEILSQTPSGLHLSMSFEGQQWELHSQLVGRFNALNLLGAQAIALSLGVQSKEMILLESFTGVPGRLERIANDKGLNVFVDYAHTPDALIKAIEALKDAGFKRIVSVFGCGGNRDKTKRLLMGKAVADFADVAVVTSDNPRHENPEAIIDDIMPGLASCNNVHRCADRALALKKAVEILKPDDALLVAGKGHETYQIIGDEKRDFSDQAILRGYLL